MARIYRIESRNSKTGMYNAGRDLAIREAQYDEEETRHPAPREDARLVASAFEHCMMFHDEYGYINIAQCCRFGFATIAQMRSWVYKQEWRTELYQKNFHIVVLECEEVAVGDTQAMYNHEGAWHLVETIDVRIMDHA